MSKITIAWSLVFALVHFYWAATADGLGAQLYIAFIAVIGLASAVVAHRHHTRLAKLGGAALLLGVAVGTARWIAGDELGAGGIVITLYFLIGGVLFSLLGWRPANVRRTGGIRLPVRFVRS